MIFITLRQSQCSNKDNEADKPEPKSDFQLHDQMVKVKKLEGELATEQQRLRVKFGRWIKHFV